MFALPLCGLINQGQDHPTEIGWRTGKTRVPTLYALSVYIRMSELTSMAAFLAPVEPEERRTLLEGMA